MTDQPSSSAPTKLLFVFGTRPEAIKMVPLIDLLRGDSRFAVRVCVTGQHREMLSAVLELFDVRPDFDLDIMQAGQTLSDTTVQTLRKLAPVLEAETPDWVFVQGDTTSTFAASLAAFYARVPVAHLEAGLRTWDPAAPYPEEMNRVLTSRLAALHFAPTETARENLLREGVPPDSIHVTGNTVIDALLTMQRRIQSSDKLRKRLDEQFAFLDPAKRLILATTHRRESFGEGLESICRGLVRIVEENGDAEIVLPVHLNPNVREPVRRILGGSERIHLVEPVDYVAMVYLQMRAFLVVTDSGGLQEEAPALAKPVLVMREKTERPEGISGGNAILVGTDEMAIAREARLLLTQPDHRRAMSRESLPFGSGDASRRIVDLMLQIRERGVARP